MAIKWKTEIFKYNDTTTIAIGLWDSNKNIFLVSPLTSFIHDCYLNTKTSTQMAASRLVVAFLNYILSCNKELEDISYQDAIDFLSSTNASRTTKINYKNYLQHFYLFLNEHDFISVRPEKLQNFKFTGFKNNKQKSKDVIHFIELDYIPLFLQCAKDVAPDIAFGIFLQLFGGLRCSEVISLEYSNIHFSRKNDIKTMYVSLIDKDLRPDIKNGFINKTKKNRKQQIIPAFGNMLFDLYTEHKLNYKNNNSAVFIDANGNPMTSATYSRKFNKVKKHFIDTLSQSNDLNARAYAVYLSTYRWSTHICRGVFSNLIAQHASNVSEIAAWRGDSSLSSSIPYLNDNQVVSDKVLNVLNQIYKE